MIPCHVCGKNAETAWVIGFPPAPDSQKMGLCAEHDNPKSRLQVQNAWQELIYSRIAELNRIEAFRQGGDLQLLSLYFIGGGSISIPCAFFSLTDNNTLKITTHGGELIFFPLAQVRNYALTPLDPAQTAEAARELPGGETPVLDEANPATEDDRPDERGKATE